MEVVAVSKTAERMFGLSSAAAQTKRALFLSLLKGPTLELVPLESLLLRTSLVHAGQRLLSPFPLTGVDGVQRTFTAEAFPSFTCSHTVFDPNPSGPLRVREARNAPTQADAVELRLFHAAGPS